MSFQKLFSPNGVAVFGSASTGKLGWQLIKQLISINCENIYPINPKGQGVDNFAGYKSILDVTENIDLAVIAAPAFTVPQVMEDCGKKGVGAAIIISSGFSEAGNPELEDEVKAIAKKYNIIFTGPNCAGLVNTHSSLLATVEVCPPKGSTAIISQSGSVGGIIMAWAHEENLGVSKFVSYGNGADLNQIEFLEYLKTDDETKVVALYIENIVDGREFMRALKELTAVKPVVVIKSGRTTDGQRAALSHTGSMAGSDKVYDSVFAECGAIRVDNVAEMIDICKGFAMLPEIHGNKVAIVTNSGGPGVMAADRAEQLGIDMQTPTPQTLAKLHKYLPNHAGFANPFDMTLEGTAENYAKTTIDVATQYDAVIDIFIGTPFINTKEIAEAILEANINAGGKAIIPVFQAGADLKESIDFLQANGMACFMSGERAMFVIAALIKYFEYKKNIAGKTSNKEEILEEGKLFQKGQLLEPEAMQVLHNNNIPIPLTAFCKTADELVVSCTAIGYPLVMKVVSKDILHKSDFGGVMLNITSLDAAINAFEKIQENTRGYNFEGVVLYPMINDGKEVILGFTRDRQFGPVVAFGLGGIFTELLKDITLAVAPVDFDGAMKMIKSIKGYNILAGMRGEQAIDMEALAQIIVDFSKLPFKFPDLEEADLNPVFAFKDGAIVGDVRLIGNKMS